MASVPTSPLQPDAHLAAAQKITEPVVAAKTTEPGADPLVDPNVDPTTKTNIIWRFMQFELKSMSDMQDNIFGPTNPITGTRTGGLMGKLQGQNGQLSKINNMLTGATQAQQSDKDDQPISTDTVDYLATEGGGVDPQTGQPSNPLGLTQDDNGHWKNDYISWDDGLNDGKGGYKVGDKKQWQTITTELNGDSNTIRNDSQTTTIQINAALTQFQNIQQSMQQAIQGIAGAMNQLIQGAGR